MMIKESPKVRMTCRLHLLAKGFATLRAARDDHDIAEVLLTHAANELT